MPIFNRRSSTRERARASGSIAANQVEIPRARVHHPSATTMEFLLVTYKAVAKQRTKLLLPQVSDDRFFASSFSLLPRQPRRERRGGYFINEVTRTPDRENFIRTSRMIPSSGIIRVVSLRTCNTLKIYTVWKQAMNCQTNRSPVR